MVIFLYFLFKIKQQAKPLRLAFYQATSILFISVIGATLTKNTFYNLVATAVVITFLVLISLDTDQLHPKSLFARKKIIYSLGWLLLAGVVSWINFERRVNEIVFHPVDLKKYSPELGFFPKTISNEYSMEDLRTLCQLMHRQNCLYVGDMMFLYSITNSKNPWPVIHLHDSTSYYSRDSLAFTDVKRKLVENLVRYKTTSLIQDILFYGKEDLPLFALELRGKKIDSSGNLVFYEIDKVKLEWMLSNLKMSLAK